MTLPAKLANAVSRQFLARACSGWRPYYVINEFPKCGGSWVGEMVSRALDVPFPRNRRPSLAPSLLHGHYLHPHGLRNVILLWRDPRDMFVSLYYFSYFRNDLQNGALVERMKRDLPFDDYDDIQGNLPTFLKAHFDRRIWPDYSWVDFYRQWKDRSVKVATSYEAMRTDPEAELTRVVEAVAERRLSPERARVIVEDMSFERQARRAAGTEDRHSFLRKGKVGDWVNSFTDHSLAVLYEHAGEAMAEMGYDKAP